MLLGWIGFVIGGLAAYSNWDKAGTAIWYPILLVLITPICAWLGGKFYERFHLVSAANSTKNKVGYVDGYVIPMPKKNIAMYRKMAQDGARIWLKHGALDYKECISEDTKNPWGLSFPKMAKIKKGEIVVFSYIGFKSRAHRDQVNARVFKDPEMSPEMIQNKPMPFDSKRTAYGGFEVLVG